MTDVYRNFTDKRQLIKKTTIYLNKPISYFSCESLSYARGFENISVFLVGSITVSEDMICDCQHTTGVSDHLIEMHAYQENSATDHVS